MPTLRPTLNLGILAHVDAGKTSLTERLLLSAGVIDVLGSVDSGSTQTDSLELERRRGITIKSAVVSFELDGTVVNLIDTPGHPDFIAEVERVLGVLDGVVLVVSAVEGVQAQTRVLFRTVRRLGLPVIVFVNKTDRTGADVPGVLAQIRARLGAPVVPMPIGDSAVDVLTGQDDDLLQAFVDGTLSDAAVEASLRRQSQAGMVLAAYAGSAITGDGVDALLAALPGLLPSRCPTVDAPLSGVVFKVERGGNGEKIAYTQILAGSLRVRDRIPVRGTEAKVTAIQVFDDGAAVPQNSVEAGRIAKVWGLTDVRIGDTLGAEPASSGGHFAPPTLETVVVPVDPAQQGRLHTALTQLAEQDPLINLRKDDVRQEFFLSLYGEVQKEVIQTTLAEQYALDVAFRETTTLCIERPVASGESVEFIAKDPNPFLATVGLRVDPGKPGSGVTFQLGVELGSMPYSFFKAVEETVHETLEQGVHGWPVTDIVVTMTHSGYWARQSHAHGSFDKSMSSTAGDFRNLTPLILMAALRQAGTEVLEPVHQFDLEFPVDVLTAVPATLARLGATPGTPSLRGDTCALDGEIPAARVHELQLALPGLTRGEGVLEFAFSHYEPVRGPVPDRQRIDHNPLDRKEYLLHVQRRV
ncbi:translation factor GTPase family protein [Hamadaea sp. NPDC051192]|uniref:translation factor GTPase family protein n=1 Tax=Hamadaea sp. NPDC051192 TaxID=3154940 RepID=UPI00343E7C5C